MAINDYEKQKYKLKISDYVHYKRNLIRNIP